MRGKITNTLKQQFAPYKKRGQIRLVAAANRKMEKNSTKQRTQTWKQTIVTPQKIWKFDVQRPLVEKLENNATKSPQISKEHTIWPHRKIENHDLERPQIEILKKIATQKTSKEQKRRILHFTKDLRNSTCGGCKSKIWKTIRQMKTTNE